MELYVFDINFNRLGIIDDFIDVEIEKNYDKLGSLVLTLDGTKEWVDLLQVDRIIANATDINKGYLIKTREYVDENSSELQIIAPSLNTLLNDRIVLGQQEFTGTLEDVMKSFVLLNAVNPINPNRIIPNLVISTNRGININTTEGTVNKPLADYLYELCKKHDVSFDIVMDHVNKKFVFDVWQGMDRSTLQLTNPHVIFAKDFDNVLKQDFTESTDDLKTTAIVYGEEVEGQPQVVVTINDEKSGYERKEIVVVTRGISKTYVDENNVEVTLSDNEYKALLSEEGKNKLSEYTPIQSFESEVDGKGYGVDYFMGDKVSIRNDELGIIMHSRIMSITQKIDRQGELIEINFGSNIPSFVEKVKRAVK